MDYRGLGEWVAAGVDMLVSFGVPRADAESLLATLECGAIAAEAEARIDIQFLLDLKRAGTAGVMARTGLTRQAVHKRKTKINRRLTARLTG